MATEQPNHYYNRWSYLSLALFALVFIGLFYGRAMQRYVGSLPAVILCLVVTLILATVWQFNHRTKHKLRREIFAKAGVVVASAIYITLAIATFLYVPHKIETVHFLEFSLLAIFMLFAWATAQPELTSKLTARAALFAALCSLAVGATEEYLQNYAPQRFYDPRDIILNAIAAAVGGTLGFLCLKRN